MRRLDQAAEHSAHPSSKTCGALLTLTARVTLASAARISLAATPDTFSSLLRFWHVDSDPELSPQILKANQSDTAIDTLKGNIANLPKQNPKRFAAEGTTKIPFTPRFLHQFTKMPSAFTSTLGDTPLIFIFADAENIAGRGTFSFSPDISAKEPETLCFNTCSLILRSSSAILFGAAAQDSVLETQAEEDDKESTSSESASGGKQE